MRLKYLLAALLCFMVFTLGAKWAWGVRFGYTHYNASNMACSSDSVAGGLWDNASITDCNTGSVIYWLADRASYVGTGGGLGQANTGAHTTPLFTRNPNIILSTYETITDEPYGPSTAWYQFLDAHVPDELDEYEKSFMHWGEQTYVMMEPQQGNCLGVRFPANNKVVMYFTAGSNGAGGTTPNLPIGAPVDSAWGPCNCASAPQPCGNERKKVAIYDWTQFPVPPSRYAVCFSDSIAGDRARVRQLHKEYLVGQVQARGQITGTPYWYKGLFGDNCSWDWYNWGQRIGSTIPGISPAPLPADIGGHVREAIVPDHMHWNGEAATDFTHWKRFGPPSGDGMNDFLRVLSDTFDLGDLWYGPVGAKRDIELHINIATGYDRAWGGDEANLFFSELQLNLTNNRFDSRSPLTFYNASTNRPMYWTSAGKRCNAGAFNPCQAGATGCLNYSQLLYNCYALYRASDSGDDVWGMQYTTTQGELTPVQTECGGPSSPTNPRIFASDKRWNEKVWGPIIDVTTATSNPAYLGNPTGAMVLHWESGTLGESQRIYRRPFERGWVWVRNIDMANSTDSLLTSIQLNFSDNGGPTLSQYLVRVDGTLSPAPMTYIQMPAVRSYITINSNAGQYGVRCRLPASVAPGTPFWADFWVKGNVPWRAAAFKVYYDSTRVIPIRYDYTGVGTRGCMAQFDDKITGQPKCGTLLADADIWMLYDKGTGVASTDSQLVGRVQFLPYASGSAEIRPSCGVRAENPYGQDGVNFACTESFTGFETANSEAIIFTNPSGTEFITPASANWTSTGASITVTEGTSDWCQGNWDNHPPKEGGYAPPGAICSPIAVVFTADDITVSRGQTVAVTMNVWADSVRSIRGFIEWAPDCDFEGLTVTPVSSTLETSGFDSLQFYWNYETDVGPSPFPRCGVAYGSDSLNANIAYFKISKKNGGLVSHAGALLTLRLLHTGVGEAYCGVNLLHGFPCLSAGVPLAGANLSWCTVEYGNAAADWGAVYLPETARYGWLNNRFFFVSNLTITSGP